LKLKDTAYYFDRSAYLFVKAITPNFENDIIDTMIISGVFYDYR